MSSYARAKAAKEAEPEVVDRMRPMCAAHGCPNRWSVDTGNGRLCGPHAGADASRWPEVTQQQQWAETERARANGEPPLAIAPLTHSDKLAILNRLRAIDFTKHSEGGKEWAYALRDREQGGERLSMAQRTMWREALGLPITGAIATWEQTPEEYAAGQPGRHA